MLSAGRGIQLRQTHRRTRTIGWTNTFMSRGEGWLFSFSLIFISFPLGTAWPFGKSCAVTLPLLHLFVSLFLSLFLCSQQPSIHTVFILFLLLSVHALQPIVESQESKLKVYLLLFLQIKRQVSACPCHYIPQEETFVL